MTLSRREFELAILGGIGALFAPRGWAASPVDVPWLASVQISPPVLPPDAPRLPSLLVLPGGERITSSQHWGAKREELRTAWRGLLGTWEPPRTAPIPEVLMSERLGQVTRQLIKYDTSPGESAEAYYLFPTRAFGPLRGAVVFHASSKHAHREPAGLAGTPDAAWGLRLAERGIAALCPRSYLAGEGSGDPLSRFAALQDKQPQARGMAKLLFDAQRALDVLASMPQINARWLGAAGHDLGGKQALYLAAFDDRVKATVISEAGIGTRFSDWDAPWLLGTREWPREHHELLALVAPRACLVIGGNGADGARTWPFIDTAAEVYRLYGPPALFGFFNHGQGHRIPAIASARTIEWLETYL